MVKDERKEEEEEEEEEEDDYMNMAIADPAPAKESSFARARRLKAESAARGVIKSKAQLKEEEEAARERALSTSMLDGARAKKSKGFAMMAKMGFSGGGLGKKDGEGKGAGRMEPIALMTKEDRGGIGLENERKRKAAEVAAAAAAADAGNGEGVSKVARLDPMEYRDRVRREREDEKLEKQFYAAQRMAERLDDEKMTATAGTADWGADEVTPMAGRPLKSIPVLYRGLVKHRMEGERLRRMRHDLEQSLSSRLPTYDDPDEDDDYKKALGRGGDGNKATVYAEDEELDEEDEELDRFGKKEARERLRAGLEYLRREHRYCFWCKSKYDDEDMEGCPGVDEEDHD